jgi:hypothetical protein
MPIKVELHPDVVWFLKHRCRPDDVDAFCKALDGVRIKPIAHSEATADPRLSQYMLRFFRFGVNIAIFEFDPGKNRIRVLECRRLPAKGRPKRKNDDADAAP